MSLRIDAFCHDPSLIDNKFDKIEMRHFGLDNALEELKIAEQLMVRRKERWPSRQGWFDHLIGKISSKRGQLELRKAEMFYYSLLTKTQVYYCFF